jgi:hypothetical protein
MDFLLQFWIGFRPGGDLPNMIQTDWAVQDVLAILGQQGFVNWTAFSQFAKTF